MSKKNIVVLTPGSFIDTDITVVKHLQKEYDVAWYVIQKKGERYSEESIRNFVEGSGIELHYIEHTYRYRSSAYRKLLFGCIKEMVAMKAQLIHTAQRDLFLYLGYKLYASKIPMVMGVHDVAMHSNNVNLYPGALFVFRLCRSIGKEFVLYSKNQYELFRQYYPRLKANFVGMSSKNFGEAPQQPHFQNDIRKLLFFGSMQSYKGIDLLIRAFEELIEEGVTNLRLSIFGKFATQTYQEECQAMIKHPEFYNLSYQFVDNKDIPSLFASHDFTMFPYRDATQSGPLMINVNYGLPIVAPNHTCFADTYVNGETAFLYNDSLDYRSLKEALRRTSTISKAEYEAMLKQCEVLKDTYSEENIAKNYIRVFNRILAD